MELTKEQESEYLKKWTPLVFKAVRQFMAHAWAEVAEDDLYQEGMIAMLLQIRAARDEEELVKRSWNAVRNAMARYVIGQSARHFPVRTSAYTDTLTKTRGDRVSLDGNEMLNRWETYEDGWIMKIDWQDFLAKLTPRQRDFIRLRQEGHANLKIAEEYGVTPACVTLTVKRARKRFMAQQKGD